MTTSLLVFVLVVLAILYYRYRRLRSILETQTTLLIKSEKERNSVKLYLNRIAEPFQSQDQDQNSRLNVIVSFMCEITQADAGICYLLHEDDGALWAHSIVGDFPPLKTSTPYVLIKRKYINQKVRSEKIELGEGIIGEVALKKKGALILDPSSDSRISRVSLDMLPFSNIMVAPLVSKGRTLGVLAVVKTGGGDGTAKPEAPENRQNSFSEDDLSMLTALGYQAASTVEMMKMFHSYAKEEASRFIIEKELNLAREFQQTLLPTKCPVVPGYDVAVFSRAAREVGGDYYDVFWVDEHERYLGIVVADVSGKGIPGAFVMSMTKAALRVIAKNRLNPLEVLLRCNDRLYEDTKESVFVTITYGLLDTSTGQFRYVRAGHEPLLKFGGSGPDMREIEQEEPDGVALGMIPTADLQGLLCEYTTQLHPGQTLLLYTDGAVEAENPSNQEFGRDRFVELINAHAGEHPEKLLENVVREIDLFVKEAPQHDDITLLAIRFHDNVAFANANVLSIAPV